MCVIEFLVQSTYYVPRRARTLLSVLSFVRFKPITISGRGSGSSPLQTVYTTHFHLYEKYVFLSVFVIPMHQFTCHHVSDITEMPQGQMEVTAPTPCNQRRKSIVGKHACQNAM